MHYLALIAALAVAITPTNLWAHGGGLAADGCHNDRKNGGRHCHRGDGGAPPPPPQRALSGSLYFPNCTSARAAGVAPVRAGQAGYGRHLDRDGDGIGCE
jgi:Excalibur calcium-binding domain